MKYTQTVRLGNIVGWDLMAFDCLALMGTFVMRNVRRILLGQVAILIQLWQDIPILALGGSNTWSTTIIYIHNCIPCPIFHTFYKFYVLSM